jgi:putative FmdB family regulatory protein
MGSTRFIYNSNSLMPLYEYECRSCSKRFELIQKFSDPPPTECPNCGGGPVHKLISSPAIQFKGSGFYITDYARSGSGAEKESGTKSTGAEAATGDGAPSKTSTKDSGKTEGAAKADVPAPSVAPAKSSD